MSKKLLNLLLVIMMLAVLVPTVSAAPPAQEEGQDYVVVADDWLSKLADKYLGNPMAYPAIVEYTNQKNAEDSSYAKITDPDLIEVGWKVYIPSAAEAEAYVSVVVAAPPTPVPDFVGLVFQDVDNLDPATGRRNSHMRFYDAVYPGLVRFETGTLEVEPELAKSWEMSEDGLLYTFKLREGVKFHDGTTLDAEDVKLSFDRIREIGLGYSYELDVVEEIRIVDPMTVEFALNSRKADFLNSLTLFTIVSADAVKTHEKDGDLAQEWLAEHEAGAGPFMLELWTPNQDMIVTRFPDYWRGWEGKHLNRIIWRTVGEPATQTLVMEAGDAHYAENVSVEDAVKLDADPRFEVYWTSAPYVYEICMNTNKPPLDDLKVRRAMRYAFNYQAYVDTVFLGHALVPQGVINPASPWHDPSIPEEVYDLDKAKELLAEAGYPDGGFTIELLYNAPEDWERRGCEIFQNDLAKLGVNLQISAEPWGTLVASAQNPDLHPHMIFWASSPISGHPNTLLPQRWYSKSKSTVYFGYSNPEVDRLLEAGSVETDFEKSKAIYYEAQRLINEDSPGIYAVIKEQNHVLSANVKGVKVSVTFPYVISWYEVYFE